MNSFTTMGWIHFSFVLLRVITFILYFHYPSYALPSLSRPHVPAARSDLNI